MDSLPSYPSITNAVYSNKKLKEIAWGGGGDTHDIHVFDRIQIALRKGLVYSKVSNYRNYEQ